MSITIRYLLLAVTAFAVSNPVFAINTKTEEFVYPPEVKGIIDVTKAPYFAENAGGKYCRDA